MALTPDRIIAACLEILDEFGLADLTMRRVAAVLDVKAGALYWHFPNKQTLLAGVADEILAGLRDPAPGLPVDQWLMTWAARLRQVLLAHRDAAELVASALAMGLGRVDPCAAGRERLAAAGLGPRDADAVMQAFCHFVLGHVVEEQTREQLVGLGVLAGFDQERSEHHFAVGVRLLSAGTTTLGS